MLGTTIQLAGHRVHLVSDGRDCEWCDNHAAHTRLEARSVLHGELNSAVQGQASAMADCRDLATTYGLLHDVHRVTDAAILEHVAWLLETGRLIAVDCRIPLPQRRAAPAALPPTPARPRSRPSQVNAVEAPIRTWVAVELVDDAGTPVANKAYVVKIPDGTKKEGRLNGEGWARIDQINPGTCEISFPNIDGREWRPI